MSDQALQPNSRFRLYRKGPGDADFKFVCLATTISFKRTATSEDVTVNDCDNPAALPHERTVKTGTSWAVDFSGKSDPLRIQAIEADYEATDPSQYQLISDVPLAQGGQTYTGAMHITDLTLSRPEKGAVAFTASGNLGTLDVIAQLYLVSTGETVETDTVRSTTSAVAFTFATAPASGAYRAVIAG